MAAHSLGGQPSGIDSEWTGFKRSGRVRMGQRCEMRKAGDVIGGIFFILVGIGAIAGGIGLQVGSINEPQPGFFPFVGGSTLVVLASILLVLTLQRRSQGGQTFGEIRRPALLVVAMILYVVVVEFIGYPIATAILSGVVLRILGVRWGVLCVTSLVLSVVTYILFDRFLDVTLPLGVLESLR